MAWTEMQSQAIHKRGKNILVSAGAGSGKTAVLSERILEYCLDGNDICSFLVLTFTNAAAAEMKERIRKKLIAHNLREQASRIDSAYITTFDAYSLA
ncbi:MAG: UvrD-helicase domain-containing protein, partial [Anaeroplasmataceae bacterium]|nr:UvrD-helicase domain-containing protein [Anaeroplasmataceae bacterium]